MRTFLHICDDILRMQISSLILIFFALGQTELPLNSEKISLVEWCYQSLNGYKSYRAKSTLLKACEKVMQNQGCTSVGGKPIFHLDQKGKNEKAKNILVISLIHGDEIGAGSLGRYWLERVQEIDPRNNWRIIPVANPDGAEKKLRTNASGVDLNRNFPTADWETEAVNFWKKEAKSSVRKFPGEKAASEPEVNCLLGHIQEFKPQFVISIHTPLNVLDYDGPKVPAPNYNYLPWRRLGNFPGSLGRYLWVEQKVPVLTTELKSDLPAKSGVFDQLQDVIGQLVQTDLK
jgi:murein peptide amidase A